MSHFLKIKPRLTNLLFIFMLSNLLCAEVQSQEVGVSASFFLPKDGYFSAPISPISFRGYGINFTDYFSLESGIVLYRMSGLNVKNLPFESKKPLIGPTFTLMIPLELVLQFGTGNHVIELKGGGFAFHSIDQKINEGNLDRALRDFYQWTVANSDFSADNSLGLGIQFGVEYIIYLNNSFGLSFGGAYYIGDADVNLRGSVSGGVDNGTISTIEEDFNGSKVDYTGLEISVGIIFTGN